MSSLAASTVLEGCPVIPVSAQLGFNIDAVCQHLATKVAVPTHDFAAAPKMAVLRSFDVNKPGCPAAALAGGVLGGSVQRGVLRLGEAVEIRPGLVTPRPGVSGQYQFSVGIPMDSARF